jgi:hypothetical protein
VTSLMACKRIHASPFLVDKVACCLCLNSATKSQHDLVNNSFKMNCSVNLSLIIGENNFDQILCISWLNFGLSKYLFFLKLE